MIAVLGITLPLFAAVLLGYLCVRGGLFKPTDMRLFGSFVLNVALPALLFLAVATRDARDVFNITYMAVFATGALLTIAASFIILTLLKTTPSRRAVAVMGTSCANSGFVGYPLMLLAFPDSAGQILALNMLVENFLIIPLCLVLFELSKERNGTGIIRLIGQIALNVLRRPMVIALLLGLAVSLLRVPLPEPILRTTSLFAASASALALFTIGGALVGLPFKGHRALAALTAAGKLLLHPALAALALAATMALGLPPLSRELATAVILSAAIPMFSIYALFAAELGHEGMASIAQVLATGASFLTLSALMLWLL
ncbi:MAG: AEC family transporter [Lentibacter algarum]|uniref:AEC family transporter n=1 Tax=Lentibacter algarum TaxID=576131 RepID=UPI00235325F9|nr:AEC family transporter [Lentibacter algarum]MCO4777907.1 AEC family transporter [Lentibacter algarum]